MASSLWYTCDGRVALRDCVVFLIGIDIPEVGYSSLKNVP